MSTAYDKERYRGRNRIERFFNKFKQFRRIATHYDKLKSTLKSTSSLLFAPLPPSLLPRIRKHDLGCVHEFFAIKKAETRQTAERKVLWSLS